MRLQSHGLRRVARKKKFVGPSMTLSNMRELGVQRLIVSRPNDACRHTAVTDV